MNLRPLLCILWLLGGWFVHGQNRQLLYDFIEIPQATLVNPGVQTTYDWYAGIPVLSGFSVQAGMSGISVNDIFADDGLDINDKVRDRAINSLRIRDEVSGTMQIDLLHGGFRSRRNPRDFYSFGIYLEGDGINYWPRDLADLAFNGNADQLGRRYRLDHLKTRGELVNVFHFGLNRQMNANLVVGARAKLYSSIANFSSTRNDGYFVTREGENNLLSSTLVADMVLRTSGLNAFKDIIDDDTIDNGQGIAQTFRKRALLGGDLGLGFDIGFTYKLSEQWVVTGSLLDIGFVYSTSDVRSYTLNGRATTEGVEVILPDALADPNADFWQDLVDEIEALVPFEKNTDSYLWFRPTKLHGSVRYDFGAPAQRPESCDCDYRTTARTPTVQFTNSAGAKIYAINRPRGPQTALSLYYLRRFGRTLTLKTSYTVDKFSATNIGLGMNLQAGPVNFYLLADNLLAYQNIAASRYASFQIGFNIISWGAN